MIIDSHVHFGPAFEHYSDPIGPVFSMSTERDLLLFLDREYIDMAVIVPPRWFGGEYFDPNYEQGNKAIAAAVKAHPDRLIGYGRVNPNWGRKAVAEARRCLTEYRLKGLKLDPEWESFFPTNKSLVHPLLNEVVEHSAVVMFHTGYFPAEPALLIELALAYPHLPIVMGHMGGRLTGDAIIAAKKAPNLILEASGNIYYLSDTIKAVGADRIMFGSNTPFDFAKLHLEKLDKTPGISPKEKALILGENAARLHGVKTPVSAEAAR
jgi:uncharacterized protein